MIYNNFSKIFIKKKEILWKKIDCIRKEEKLIKITPSTEKMEDNSPAILQGL